MVDKSLYHDAIKDKMQKYGLPDQKKYPMPDRKHVISAIKFFNYVDPAHEKELAKNILKRIKEYGMSFDDFGVGEDNRFSKYLPKEDYLAHHGILGQKWGIRRYQNPDGTLTDAGKKRIIKDVNDRYKAHKKHRNENEASMKIYEHVKNATKSSKELSKIHEEARQLSKEEDSDYYIWVDNKDKVRETAASLLKTKYNEEPTKENIDRYLKDAGGDAYTNMWEHEKSRHQNMKERSDRIFELYTQYRDESKKYFNNLLGVYGKMPVPGSLTYTYADYMGNRAEDHFYDLIWLEDLK